MLQTLSCPVDRLPAFTSNRLEPQRLWTVRLDGAFFWTKAGFLVVINGLYRKPCILICSFSNTLQGAWSI